MTGPGTEPAPADGLAPGRRTVLVVGYDDQPGAAEVLRVAAELGHRLQASLLVVHALPVLPLVAGAELGASAALAAPRDEAETAAASEAARRRAAEQLDPSGVSWSWACTVAEPAHLIEQHAEAAGAFLVVAGIGERGWGAAVEHLVMGSTSRALRKEARWPLLLVPPAGGTGHRHRHGH